ncbi:hypothetical protein LTR94_027608, partial [Friedmanniomyces endolithicus]
MANHVLGGELQDPDALHPVQNAKGVPQAGIARIEKIDLGGIAGHHHSRALSKARQNHLHLETRGVLGLVDNDEGVAQ